MPYREKRILAGKILDVEIYPISKIEQKKSRSKKKKESRKEQKNLNEKNAKKQFRRIVNNNFTEEDYKIELTYKTEFNPETIEEAHREFKNFIRRVNRKRKKVGLDNVKYVAVIEKRGKIHHHVIMDGMMDRRTVEDCWGKGRCKLERLQGDEKGFEALANYMMKKPLGKKRWVQSRNIIIPDPKINDYKYSRRKVYDMFLNKDDGRFFEKLYPGYAFTESEVADNDITGVAINIKMRKIE